MEFIFIKPKKKGSAPEGGVTERPKVTTTTMIFESPSQVKSPRLGLMTC
jgi:hypothetical protein